MSAADRLDEHLRSPRARRPGCEAWLAGGILVAVTVALAVYLAARAALG